MRFSGFHFSLKVQSAVIAWNSGLSVYCSRSQIVAGGENGAELNEQE